MKPVYITPRVLAHFYLNHEARINEDAEILLVLPDGTPCRAPGSKGAEAGKRNAGEVHHSGTYRIQQDAPLGW